jgi:hypothetical protein
VPPVPAECTRKAFEAFSESLAGLDDSYAAPCPLESLKACREAKARTLLTLKSQDAEQYRQLRAQALRCAAK